MVWFEVIIVGSISLIVGFIVGFILNKRTNIIDKVSKHERYKQSILNDPELLLEKLKEHGEITDMGKKVAMSIEEIDGKKQIKIDISDDAVTEEELAEKIKLTEKKEEPKKEVIESIPEEENVAQEGSLDELEDEELVDVLGDENEYSEEDLVEEVLEPVVPIKKKKKSKKKSTEK